MRTAEQSWGLVLTPREESPKTPLCLLSQGPPPELPSICTPTFTACLGCWGVVCSQTWPHGSHQRVDVRAALPHRPGIFLSGLEEQRENRRLSEGVQGPGDPKEQGLWSLQRRPDLVALFPQAAPASRPPPLEA